MLESIFICLFVHTEVKLMDTYTSEMLGLWQFSGTIMIKAYQMFNNLVFPVTQTNPILGPCVFPSIISVVWKYWPPPLGQSHIYC